MRRIDDKIYKEKSVSVCIINITKRRATTPLELYGARKFAI